MPYVRSHNAQLVSNSPSFTNGLSIPPTTPSHNGQLPARTSSSSLRILSAFFSSFSVFLLPPPIPGIHATGAVTTLARASGTIRSRSRSPAERRLRPNELAARAPFCSGMPKLAESSVRWLVGCLEPGGTAALRSRAVYGVPLTSSVCSARILRRADAGRHSLAYTIRSAQFHQSYGFETYLSNETIRMKGMLTRKYVELPRK